MDANIRHEIIYKNLLRDIRKALSMRFNSATNYKIFKYRRGSDFYSNNLNAFIIDEFSLDLLENCRVSFDEFKFFLGSFIYPKVMIK